MYNAFLRTVLLLLLLLLLLILLVRHYAGC